MRREEYDALVEVTPPVDGTTVSFYTPLGAAPKMRTYINSHDQRDTKRMCERATLTCAANMHMYMCSLQALGGDTGCGC